MHNFDEQGRDYWTQVFSVDQVSGAPSQYSLDTQTWCGHRGQVPKTSQPGGLVTKEVTDGAGRVTTSYLTDGGGDTSWTDAGNVSGDNVLEHTQTFYNQDGNPFLTISRQRNHDETATGALGDRNRGPKARVSYVASYYDADQRLAATVNYGTNRGTRPTDALSQCR